jgi:hypothetical protein
MKAIAIITLMLSVSGCAGWSHQAGMENVLYRGIPAAAYQIQFQQDLYTRSLYNRALYNLAYPPIPDP